MEGPKAPKDPTAKGSSFFVCRGKDVAGNPAPDGEGVQFIYLDGGRLVTFARMVGNVTDEKMLHNVTEAAGFKDMVAGIGVTVESEERDQTVGFVFQMYGKTDPYMSGTTISVECTPDGMEKIFWLDDFEWSDDDDKPGQFRFVFDKPGRLATVDIRFYLREGYTAPEQEEVNKIETDTQNYRDMISRSLMSKGNNARLKKAIDKAKRGEEVTIAFIGGSITQGAGAIPIDKKSYAYQTWEQFTKEFGKNDNVKLIKAGVGGTPSELGMIRFERDVLREGAVKPDIVVIEFAVNDEGDETKGRCFECLARKALDYSEDCAVVLIFAVFANDFNLQERLGPVGVRYELPMVSVKDAVTPQFYLNAETGRILTKSQFFYDVFHPANMGHKIMADCLMNLFRAVDADEADAPIDWRTKECVFGSDFTHVRLLDKHTNFDKIISLDEGDFTETDEDVQKVEMDANFFATPEFPYNWKHSKGSKPFVMKLKCKALLLVSKDTGDVNHVAKASVKVDGREVLVANPAEVGWTHCNPQILFTEEESKEHVIEIAPVAGDEDKWFTILGFGFVE